ncbi:hypothetical protein CASFOL_020613 [Castilleja foliolosa]|uniref:DUF1639 family protein n=1 Tax=Castilleja foliolosa TaxID=1961234 RepID=A0ABD3D1C6_9LAMI
MAMGTERSKQLHNFTLPCDLQWGKQRFLRCMKVNSSGEQISPRHRGGDTNSSGSSDHHLHHQQIQQRRTTRGRDRETEKDSPAGFANGSPKTGHTPPPAAAATGGSRRFNDVDDDGVAATRVKVMGELQTAADQMKNALFKDGCLEEGEISVLRPLLPPPPPPPPAAALADGEINRPWNLRTRRAACRTPTIGVVSGKYGGAAAAAGGGSNGGVVKGLRVDAPRLIPGFTQMRAPAAASIAQKSPIHRSDAAGTAASGEKTERAKFSVSLSKRDIEEDFFSIVGHRPPRRPKKRARTVQRQLDTLFPGLWLTEVTPDLYKVPEAAP